MNPAALVIVLVGVGESGSDWAAGALQALREGLDRRVVIELRESLDPPAPAGTYVVAVAFDKGGRKATLSCREPAGRSSKELLFKKADRQLDRGRAVGYALAVLLPELRADAAPLPEPPPPPAPELPPAPPPEPVAEAKPVQPEPVPAPAPAPAPARGRVGIEATGSVASSFASREPGFGGALGLDIQLVRRLSLRLGGGARFGNSPLSGASLRELTARAGLRALLFDAEHFGVSVNAHGLLVRLDMALGAEALGRWQGGAELAVELAFVPVPMLAVVVAPAVRTTFSGTDVYVGPQRVAAIAPFVFALELGLRLWP